MKKTTIKQELIFAAAGFCGITLYYLLENIALTYTTASNVGVIVSVAPFFTAVLSCLVLGKKEKPTMSFYILSVAAAIVWALYSVLTKKISSFGFNTIQVTRRIFAYGIVFMIPFLFLFDCRFDFSECFDINHILNILFLGIGASALCFVTWNFAVKKIGAVKTSAYIYLVPIITVAVSFFVLNEKQSIRSVLGIVMTLFGLFLSERKVAGKKEKNYECSK